MSIFIDHLKLFYDDLCQHPTHLLMIDKAHVWVKSTFLCVIGNKGYYKGLSMSLVLLIMFLLFFSILILVVDALDVSALTNDAPTGDALAIDDDSDEDLLNLPSMFNDIIRLKLLWIKSI